MPEHPAHSFQLHSLHPQTQSVFTSLASNEHCNDFLLIGGTALALHVAHRQSNDLDFLFHDDRGKLPASQIDRLIWDLRAKSHSALLVTDSAQESTFRINTGERLSDYARDYAIDDVKVTFFAAAKYRHPKRFSFWQNAPRERQAGCAFSVLSLDALKIAKTLVLQDRVRSRDLFDLMILMRSHGYSIESFFANIQQYADGSTDGETERLILRGLIPLDKRDEGLASVNVTTSMPEIYDFFNEKLVEHEAHIHAEHLRKATQSAPVQLR
jgi:predicted nucleotidyltransferase component of viral defense system